MFMNHKKERTYSVSSQKWRQSRLRSFATRFSSIGNGLQKMHQLGIVDLDVKPANMLLRTRGKPLLIDFGAAQTLDSNKTFGDFQP